MRVRLENSEICVESKPMGAELTSIRMKETGAEYLWQANPEVWNRNAPILFPVVGGLAGGKYSWNGKQYSMKNHGFARDSEFDIAHESEDRVVYRFQAGAATMASYPFLFRLEVGYALEGKTVVVSWKVISEDCKEMYFSIGAHPAFNCPLEEGQPFTDYYLEFSAKETLARRFVNADNLVVAGKSEQMLRNQNTLSFTEGMFSRGAYIIEGQKSASVALKGHNTARSVTVSFPGFPFMGVWAPNGAPFVCIEPWYGIADASDFEGDLTQKKGIQHLHPGQIFSAEYRITIA